MGLDTSHDCFHGPYSQFNQWREWLNLFIMRERGGTGDTTAEEIGHMGATYNAYNTAYAQGLYADQSVPLNVLMQHSDCDGEIPADVCAALADDLQRIADRFMPERGTYDMMRPTTMRFIAGLRDAAANNEPVVFS